MVPLEPSEGPMIRIDSSEPGGTSVRHDTNGARWFCSPLLGGTAWGERDESNRSDNVG